MRLPADKAHLSVELAGAAERNDPAVFDGEGGHDALKPGHLRLDVGDDGEPRLIAVRALGHKAERLRLDALHALRAGDGNFGCLYHHASSASAIRSSMSSL